MLCYDATATIPLPTGPVSCVAQHCEGDEELPGSILLMFWPRGAYSWCPMPRETKKTVNISSMLLSTFWLFCLGDVKCFNCAPVRTAPLFPGRTRKPTTRHQCSQCSGIRGRCLRSPACPARLPDGVASAPLLATSARISRTHSAWSKHR